MQYGVAWLVAIIAFTILEGLTYQIISIWFAVGAVGALIAVLFHASLPIQLAVFVVISVLCIVFTRPLFKKIIAGRIEKTNVDAIIGKNALVTADIDNIAGEGSVKINGLEWSARTAVNSKISIGEKVIVKKVDGVKLIVKKSEE